MDSLPPGLKRYALYLVVVNRRLVDRFDFLSDALRFARDECEANESEGWEIEDTRTGNVVARDEYSRANA